MEDRRRWSLPSWRTSRSASGRIRYIEKVRINFDFFSTRLPKPFADVILRADVHYATQLASAFWGTNTWTSCSARICMIWFITLVQTASYFPPRSVELPGQLEPGKESTQTTRYFGGQTEQASPLNTGRTPSGEGKKSSGQWSRLSTSRSANWRKRHSRT